MSHNKEISDAYFNSPSDHDDDFASWYECIAGNEPDEVEPSEPYNMEMSYRVYLENILSTTSDGLYCRKAAAALSALQESHPEVFL